MKPIVSIPSLAVSLGIVAILIFLAIGATSRSTATTDVSEAVKEVSKPSDEVIATPPAPTARAAEVNRVYQPADDAVRQSVNLWNVGPAEFEGNLLRSLAGYITSRGDDNGSPEYLLHLNDDLGICLRIGMTNNQVLLEGDPRAIQGTVQMIHALDSPMSSEGRGVQYVTMPRTRRNEVARLIGAVQSGGGLSNMLAMQSARQEPGVSPQSPPPAIQTPRQSDPAGIEREEESSAAAEQTFPPGGARGEVPSPGPEGESPGAARLVAPVQVQTLEGLDALIIRGRPEDVKRIVELIRQLEQYSHATEPAVELIVLKHVDASSLGTLLEQLYQEVYTAREGALSITPLAAPNALLLIGRPESVDKLRVLVGRLDQPVSPSARFQIFRLKNIPAETAQESVTAFFTEQTPGETALLPRVSAVADFRSNSLIVRASPRDMAEAAALIARLDSSGSESFCEVRVFKLKNASAEVLAPVLQDAITGQMYGQRARLGAAAGMAGIQSQNFERKSSRLRMITIDANGKSMLSSGILTDAQVTADPRTNGLVVTASADSMPLIAALIRELDSPPSVEAQVKVFTLVNGDATNMTAMLQNIFGQAVMGDQIAVRTGVVEDDTSLVGLRFAVDVRTNSIIVTGSAGALTVVEAVLARLDDSDVRQRKSIVYRLKNSPAADVATAINQYLTNKRQVETAAPGVLSAFEQIEREVIVVPEAISNSLIVSATPRYFNDVARLVEELDRRPPMAMIQVVIAEVDLNNLDELGVELSLQDSILFDRRLATGGLAIPGSLFSNGALTGGQAVTSLGTNQLNSELSFGGLVLSASSESVSVLIRALSQCQKVKVLSRPQVMTLDNQPAQIVVGEDVPYITGTSFSEFGQQNSISYREVGLILTVTPRVSPDGLVVMEIVATNSKVGPVEQGIPVSVAGNQVIRSPRIQMISAQTVISAVDGQTVVLGGLIVEDDSYIERRVPVLSRIPFVGNLFRYEGTSRGRKELLIIMTPRIVENAEDAERIVRIESERIHWCLSDVQRLHGGYGNDPLLDPPDFDGDGPQVIYPHLTPTIDSFPNTPFERRGMETLPAPEGMPLMPGSTSNELPRWRPAPVQTTEEIAQ